MKYPDEKRMLVIRPCVKTICLNIKPAARLLAHLLYLARNCSEDEATFTVSCTQQEIIDGLIDEIDIKTLHRTAIPMLRLLGFLDVDGASYRYTYIVHLDLIQHCLEHCNNKEQLDKILIVSMQWQLDKYRIEIDKCPIELVKCPIDMDKCLIPFRQMSNSKRGRKPRTQAAVEALSENPDNKRDNRDRLDNKREGVFVATQTRRSYLEEFDTDSHFDEDDRPTQKAPAIKLNGATHATSTTDRQYPHTPGGSLDRPATEATPVKQTTPESREASSAPPAMPEGHERNDGAATVRSSSEPAPSGKRKGKKVTQAELKTPEELEFDARCTALQKRINAWRGYSLEKQGAIINERRCIRKLVEKFTDEQHDLIHQYLFTRHWRYSKPDNRYTIGGYVLLEEGDNVLQILKDEKQKPVPLADKKPMDIYTAASLDPERNKRNLERLKQRTAARLAAEGGVN